MTSRAISPPWASAWGQDEYGMYAEFEYKGIAQRMRWIAPGKFKMGSPENEPQRNEDETLHEVTLTEGYWVAVTTCTQELWQAVMGQNPSEFKDDPDGKSPKRPVEQVSWEDSKSFCERLNEALGDTPGDAHIFRLPTEAEWENACRSGTETPFSFGDNVTPDQVNYNGNHPYTSGPKGKYREKPVAVKDLPANPWGIHEMHGNVYEWCEDWFGPYEGANVVDPKGPGTGERRVLRGGSWINYARHTRSAYRYYSEPGYRDFSIGFRLVRGR
jgi:formylglycine-generating enzyme required for sulfatase activity